jgi:hypothetical protein
MSAAVQSREIPSQVKEEAGSRLEWHVEEEAGSRLE